MDIWYLGALQGDALPLFCLNAKKLNKKWHILNQKKSGKCTAPGPDPFPMGGDTVSQYATLTDH